MSAHRFCGVVQVFFWVLIAAARGGGAPATAPATQPSDRVWLIERFDREFLPQIEQALGQPMTNAEGGIAWGKSYMLSALVEMFEATRDSRYADAFVKLGRAVVDARDDKHNRKDEVRNRIVKGWGSVKYSDNRHFVWAVHTGMIIEPMARFAAIVLKDPSWPSRYRSDALFFLQTAIESDAEHEDQFRPGPGLDEAHLYGLFLNKHLPLNQQNTLARAWLWLADGTGDAKYLDRTRRLATFFKNRIRTESDGAYTWEYWPPLEGAGVKFEDVSHAAINADFLVRCAERGLVFGVADRVRLEKTLLTRVLVGADGVANTLAGGEASDRYRYAPFGWARLARHSVTVRDRLMDFTRKAAADRTCSPVEAMGLAMLVAAFPERSATSTAPSSRPASQPASVPATGPRR